MREAIIVPESLLPKPLPYRNCECMKKPIDLAAQKSLITWLKEVGETVEQGEVICEGEVDKKTVEFTAPCSGVLAEKAVEEECVCKAGDVLGYIEKEK